MTDEINRNELAHSKYLHTQNRQKFTDDLEDLIARGYVSKRLHTGIRKEGVLLYKITEDGRAAKARWEPSIYDFYFHKK